jgi:lipoprotein-releasing system ATP-binding protein
MSSGHGSGPAALELRGVERIYKSGAGGLHVLRGVDMTLYPGEMVALVGPSGAGKSTLLHLAGLLERPDRGEVLVQGEPTVTLNEGRRTLMRRRTIGFVYQFHQLLPEFSASENVELPQMIDGVPRRQARSRASELLTAVGLAGRLSHRPARLSGGEQQRVALARALLAKPEWIFLDEATASLDPTAEEDLYRILKQRLPNTTLVSIAHRPSVADFHDGRLLFVRENEGPGTLMASAPMHAVGE